MQAGVLPNPSLGVQMQDTRRDTRETTVQLSQPFELGGKRAARVQAAERGRDAAGAELECQAGRGSGRCHYRRSSTCWPHRNACAWRKSRRTLAQRASTVASRRVIAGKVSPGGRNRAHVAETGVRLELLQAKSDLTAGQEAPERDLGQSDAAVSSVPRASSSPCRRCPIRRRFSARAGQVASARRARALSLTAGWRWRGSSAAVARRT